MRTLTFRVFQATVAALLFHPVATWGQVPNDSVEAAGLLNACWSQSLAIDSYEACVDAWESAVKPDETTFEIRTIWLIGRDFSSDQHYWLQHQERRTGDTRADSVSAILFGDESDYWLTVDGRVKKDQRGDLRRIPLPRHDLRLIGHTSFPWTELLADLGRSITDRYSPAHRFALSESASRATITQLEKILERSFSNRWEVDLETLLPLEYRRSWYCEDPAGWITASREEVTWDTSRSIPVPVHVIGSRRMTEEPSEAAQHAPRPYDVDYKVSIHWESLNQPIKPEAFAFEVTTQSVRNRIDAAKRRAKFD